MAEKQFAYYEFNAQKKNIEKGTLLFIDGENIFVKQDIIPNINVGEIGATRLYFLLPYGTYTGLNPFFTIRNPKGWTSGLIAGVKITLNTTEPKTYSAVYIDLDKIGYTKIGGLHAIGLGFLENGSFITYDAVTYTVDDGVNNYENTSADVYEEIYSSIENTFIAYADRVIQAETDILNHEGRIADIETTEIPRIDSDIEDLQNEKVNKAGDTMEGSLDFDYKYAIYGLVELFVKTIASPNGRISFDNNRITDLGLALDEFDAVNLGQLLGKLTALKTDYNLWSGVNIFTKPVTIPNGETDKHAVNKGQLDTKVNKSQTIIGLDLQDNILIGEFRTALGNATQSVAGLLSAEDKTHLDGLVALLETSDGNNVVDTIGEILAIFQNYPEGVDLVTALNGKVDKVEGKELSQNDFTDIEKNKVNLSYTHSEIVNGSNPHNTKFVNIVDKPTTRDGYGIVDVYTKPETYSQLEINNLLDNLSAAKGLRSTLLTPTELSNGDTISTNLLTNNGAYVVFTATNTSTGEIDSDTVPVSTINTGKKFVFFDNQETVFTIGETNSTFETSEDITLKINLLYLYNEGLQAVDIDFDGSLTNYLEDQENVQSAVSKLDEELKTTNDNLSTHITNIHNPHAVTAPQVGLGNVDNTRDLDKPISTLTQNALNDKSNVGHTHTKSDITDFSHTHIIEDITDLIEATQALSGLMSATDKQRLDALHALLEEDTVNSVVDSINEVLAIFNNYPEGADLVTALAGKVDKVEGKGLSANDLTNTLKSNYDTAYGWGDHAVEGYLKEITKAMVEAVLTGTITTHNHSGTYEPANGNIQPHIASTSNPHGVTKAQVGLDNVDNTSDLDKPISTAQQTALDDKVDKNNAITVETWNTATKTLALSDSNKLFICSYASNQTLTIPTNATVSFPIGTMISFLLTSTYTVTFSGASGVTLTSMDSLVELATQFAMASLIKTDTNTWQLVGALE